MPRDRDLVTGTLSAVVAASLFGMLGPLARFGADAGIEGLAFTSWRATLGVAFLAVLIVARRRVGASLASIVALDRQGRATLAAAALMGLLLNAAVFTAFERIPIALALMLFYTYPAGVVVVDAALGRETITPTRLLALLLSTTGVVLVLAGGMDGSGGSIAPSASCSRWSPRRPRSCSSRSAATGTGRCRPRRRRWWSSAPRWSAARCSRWLWDKGRRWSRRSGPWRRGRPCCSPASRRRGSRRCCS
jgi:drug/metabolite transporter (DMT)-like permease